MNDFKDRTVCFTGHRQIIHDRLSEKLEEIITTLAKDRFLYYGVGGAKGFDFIAAKSVLKVRENFKDIKLIVSVPYRGYYNNWGQEEKEEYFKILRLADKVKFLSEDYYRGCMQVRNRHLVDNSSVCVNYLYKTDGGTAFTVDYARKKGLTLISVV